MPSFSDLNRASWKASSPESYDFAAWGDESIVYHRPSGTTHFLNSASLALVRDILQEPRTGEEIAAVFGASAVDSEEEAAGIRHEILSVLGHLEHIGLIERL